MTDEPRDEGPVDVPTVRRAVARNFAAVTAAHDISRQAFNHLAAQAERDLPTATPAAAAAYDAACGKLAGTLRLASAKPMLHPDVDEAVVSDLVALLEATRGLADA